MAATTQIRIDEEVKARLAELRRGWETPNATLRRLLNLEQRKNGKK